MKSLLLAIALLGFGLTTVQAAHPAKEAIRALARERGADLLNRVVHVVGHRGAQQPAVWRIVVRENHGMLREFFLSNGQVISEGLVPAKAAQQLAGAAVPMKSVTADSADAFAKADAIAREARIPFTSVNYQLRCLELSQNPAWFLQLMDSQGNRVGALSISAATGEILSRQWFTVAAAPVARPVLQPARYPTAPQTVVAGQTRPYAPAPRTYPGAQR
jgi:hypothetical protein